MNVLCPLASGSKGNCTYLGTPQVRVLIDAGISGRAIKQRLAEIEVEPEQIDAILITHEHTDHIQGLRVMALRFGIPVIANHETAKVIASTLGECPKFKIFTTGDSFQFHDLIIRPFSVPHDAVDPVGFTMETSNTKIGVCTDLGYVPPSLKHILAGCNLLLLEANHEPEMVHACSRPDRYKERVLGKQGHLSNQMAGKLIKEILHDRLTHVQLCHLSQECNSQERALHHIRQALGSDGPLPSLSVAYQEKISAKITW